MKKLGFLIWVSLLGMSLAAISSQPNRAEIKPEVSLTFDSCRNVNFVVTNNRNIAIDIKEVKYYNADEKRWQTENMKASNERCEKGAKCYIFGEDLHDSEGDRITKVIFRFKDANSDTMRESQEFNPTDPACRADKEYGHGQGWAIAGKVSTTASGSNGLGDACKNVSFLVKNGIENKDVVHAQIKIDKVKYFNRMSGKWKTEDVSGVDCWYGDTCTVGGPDDLADANNDEITKIIFIYRKANPEFPAKPFAAVWLSPLESKVFVPESPKCHEGKVYGTGQGWTIGGGSSASKTPATNTSTTSSSTSTSTGTNPNPNNRPVVKTNKTKPKRS